MNIDLKIGGLGQTRPLIFCPLLKIKKWALVRNFWFLSEFDKNSSILPTFSAHLPTFSPLLKSESGQRNRSTFGTKKVKNG